MKYNDKVYVVCYNSLDVFNSKKEAKDFYSTCYYMSEGAEHERYASILADLNFCDTGRDNISKYCQNIRIKLNEDKEEFLVVELGKPLSIEETIKYYESKIKTILKISEDFDVNFDSTIPFEDFDDTNFNMYSFSEYYKKIFEKMNIHFNNITTKEASDGKYELNLDNNILDVRAWDKLNDVVSNVESALEFSTNKNIEMEV